MIKSTLFAPPDWIHRHPLFPAAFEYLRAVDPSVPIGRYELQGERLFANVQAYETRKPAEVRFEAHRRYIDIQYLVSGSERMACLPVQQLASIEPYSEARDVEFFHSPTSNYPFAEYHAGDLAVFFPEDAHQPCCALGASLSVKKIVLKVAAV